MWRALTSLVLGAMLFGQQPARSEDVPRRYSARDGNGVEWAFTFRGRIAERGAIAGIVELDGNRVTVRGKLDEMGGGNLEVLLENGRSLGTFRFGPEAGSLVAQYDLGGRRGRVVIEALAEVAVDAASPSAVERHTVPETKRLAHEARLAARRSTPPLPPEVDDPD